MRRTDKHRLRIRHPARQHCARRPSRHPWSTAQRASSAAHPILRPQHPHRISAAASKRLASTAYASHPLTDPVARVPRSAHASLAPGPMPNPDARGCAQSPRTHRCLPAYALGWPARDPVLACSVTWPRTSSQKSGQGNRNEAAALW